MIRQDESTGEVDMICNKRLINDVKITMLGEMRGDYEDVLKRLFPQWKFQDVVEIWYAKQGLENKVKMAREHRAVPIEERSAKPMPVQPAKNKTGPPAASPKRCSARLYSDAPKKKDTSALGKDDERYDSDTTEEMQEETPQLTTPDLLQRRKQLESGTLPEDCRIYHDVLKANSAALHSITLDSGEDRPKKKSKSYVVSTTKFNDMKKELSGQVSALKSQNAKLMFDLIAAKGSQEKAALETGVGSEAYQDLMVDSEKARIELKVVKTLLEWTESHKTQLQVAASNVCFENTNENFKVLRTLLVELVNAKRPTVVV